MIVNHDLTRHGRYMIQSTATDGRVTRLSVTPEAARWYWQVYSSVWDRRIIQDFDRIGARDPRCQDTLEEHSGRQKPALFVARDDRNTRAELT